MAGSRTRDMSQAIQMATIAMKDESAIGALVASVNGRPLFLGQVEKYFELFRKKQGIDGEAGWEAFAASTGATYGAMVDDTVDYLVNFMLMDDLAVDLGIYIADAEVQEQIDQANETVGTINVLTELALQGLSMEDYREGIRNVLKRMRLAAEAVDVAEPDDVTVLRFLKEQGALPEEASLSRVKEQTLAEGRCAFMDYKRGKAFDKWFGDRREEADVVIAGLPGSMIDVMLGRA